MDGVFVNPRCPGSCRNSRRQDIAIEKGGESVNVGPRKPVRLTRHPMRNLETISEANTRPADERNARSAGRSIPLTAQPPRARCFAVCGFLNLASHSSRAFTARPLLVPERPTWPNCSQFHAPFRGDEPGSGQVRDVHLAKPGPIPFCGEIPGAIPPWHDPPIPSLNLNNKTIAHSLEGNS